MSGSFTRILGYLYLSSAVLLAGCATEPDYTSLQTEGTARQVPLLIYDTSWNNPRGGWGNRMGGPVPPGQFFVELMDTQPQEITTVMVYVARCGAKASKYFGSWLMLQGPFAAGKGSKVVPVPIGESVEALLPWNQVNHLLITEVRVQDAAGKTYDYKTDVANVLGPAISNFCVTNP